MKKEQEEHKAKLKALKKNTKVVAKNRPTLKERMAATGNSNFFANAKKNNDEVKGWAFDFDKD